MKIAVSGTGYVGLVTGVCFAEMGHAVTCVDVDEKKVEFMKSGRSPIYEDGLEELMAKNADKIDFTTDYKTAYKNADVIFIAVGTPENEDGSCNLKYVYVVCDNIAESIKKDMVVVVKSTVPIGTNDIIEDYFKKNIKNFKVNVVSNPEFLSQGRAVTDTLHASRIVVGTNSQHAKEIMEKVYEPFSSPKLFTSRRSAEMIKYASNNFLALKIAYINEIANLCEKLDANVDDVAVGMGYDDRIGNKFLKAGIGYGGSCFPKDTKALNSIAKEQKCEFEIINATIKSNEKQKLKLIEKARKYYDNFKGLKIAVLGLAFKPNTDDLREAPSLVNIPVFLKEGASVFAYDLVAEKNYKKIYPTEITYCKSIEEAILDADICFIFTEWKEILEFDFKKFNLMKNKIVLDGRNCYREEIIKEHSEITYQCIGKNFR